MTTLLTDVGLIDVQITARFECFQGTSKADVAEEFAVHGVNVFARRPAEPGRSPA